MAPKQKPGRSKQDYGTPDAFLDAVRKWLDIEQFDVDLAATDENSVVPGIYYDAAMNSLTQSWKCGEGWNWLNPEFARINPWVRKAFEESRDNGAQTAVLVPAGVGANWWRDWVHGKAMAVFLNGRLTFKGTPPNPKTGKPDAYPKDCALLLYSPQHTYYISHGDWPYDVWDWTA